MTKPDYIGRFAPTPSGPLHFGSIVAALGSYLQAKQHNGKWFVRIEDIDRPRTRPGADKLILEQLESLGLCWDGNVTYQNQRLKLYEEALAQLHTKKYCFTCKCTRKETANKPYPGTCREDLRKNTLHSSIRIKTDHQEIIFSDFLQGPFSQNLRKDIGDFVIKRADGLFAYHLAVVVDDAEQGITEIVRGYDLLDSTPRQIYLQRLLKLNTPSYLHLPIAMDNLGKKISKRTDAEAVTLSTPTKTLFQALTFLGQTPPIESKNSDKESLLQWAIQHWQAERLNNKKEIQINTFS